ncbi:MAG: tRNA epoxyqueuosine(34) reductase QueG [Actinomycetota bacterium]
MPQADGLEAFAPTGDTYTDEIFSLGVAHGLHRIGATDAAPLDSARVAIESRIAGGQHDTMQFTFRNPKRSTTPTDALAGAQSILVAAMSYAAPDVEPRYEVSGKVARYAWVEYYEPLRRALTIVRDRLRADGHKALVFADDNSLVDRAVAHRAGIGWFGKNANILVPGAGSFFVLGSVVTTARLAPALAPVADGCGGCRRCLDGCPTGAIVEPGVVDARRCLAWLLQKPGVFDRAHRLALGDRMYGCDDCQEVCPPTSRKRLRVDGFDDARAWVDVVGLLEMDDDELLRTVDWWYVAQRNPDWVRRNALVVVGNVADPRSAHVRRVMGRYVEHPDPMLRAHAVWACARLGYHDIIAHHDTAPLVVEELRLLADVPVRTID